MDKAIIFDLDGVLIDSNPAHFRSWRGVCREYGVEITREAYLATIGTGNDMTIKTFLGGEPDRKTLDAISRRKEEAYRKEIEANLPIIDGAPELLASLAAAGWRLALGTSAPRDNVACVMAKLPGSDKLEVKINADMVARAKPFPDLFLRAAAELGVKPEQALVIEDSPLGVEAARRAGMKAAGLTTSVSRDELLAAGAAVVVDSLRELTPDILAELL